MLLSGGCALRHGDYALEGKLRIELSPPTGPLFYGVQVSQSGDELVVSGFGRRPEPRGHIDVVVVGPDGTTLAQARADPLPPLAVPKRTYNYRFRASMRIIPPAGSTLRVVYITTTDRKDDGLVGGRREARVAWLRHR